MFPTKGGHMEHRALDHSSVPSADLESHSTPHEGRNVWILTGYGISGLALFMVLAYYLSGYLAR
jgi:hypothetical protein